MPTYRKKPVEIQAVQWTRDFTLTPMYQMPDWVVEALDLGFADENAEGAIVLDKTGWHIVTLEGKLALPYDHYLIQGVQGEIYSCEPNIFQQTYEEVM